MSKDFNLGVKITAKDGMSGKLGIARRNVMKFDKKVTHLSKSMKQVGIASIGMGVAMAGAMAKPVMAFQEVERAKGELASLDIGEIGLSKIGREATKFSNQFAGTTKAQFISAAYDIKSGISSLSDEGVAKFTSMAAMTASATKSSTDEMTKLFALGYGIYREQFDSDFDFGEKFSGAISTAVQAFRTDGSDLVNGLSTLGAVATKNGISLAEQLAVLGVSKGAFNSASEAATSYRAFIKGAGKAQGELGLKFTDTNGRLLPMVKILEKIKGKYKDLSKKSVQDKLAKAFGSDEAVKTLLALIDKTGELSDGQKKLNDNMKEGTKVTKQMATSMNRGKEFEILGQQIGNASSIIGSLFAPNAKQMGVVISKNVLKLQEWIGANKEEAKALADKVIGITAGTLAFGAFSVALGVTISVGRMAIRTIWGVAKGFFFVAKAVKSVAFGAFKAGMFVARGAMIATKVVAGTLGIALKGLGFAFKIAGRGALWLGRAMMANPIGLAVAAIAGAAYLIYDNWGHLSEFFTGLWDSTKEIFNSTWDWITQTADAPVERIKSIWGDFKGWFSDLFPGMSEFIGNYFGTIFKVMTSPIETVKSLWGGLMDSLRGMFDWFDGAMDKIKGGIESAKEFMGISTPKTENEKKLANLKDKRSDVASDLEGGIFGGPSKIEQATLKAKLATLDAEIAKLKTQQPANKPNLGVKAKKVITAGVAATTMAVATPAPEKIQQVEQKTIINQTHLQQVESKASTNQTQVQSAQSKNTAQDSSIGEMHTVIQNQQLQIKSNNDIIAAVASRPEQHTYNVTVTINNPKDTSEIDAAVRRAISQAHRSRENRKLGDVE